MIATASVDEPITYSSSKTEFVEVNSSTGEITAKAEGISIITASIRDGAISDTATVSVSAASGI